MPLTQGDACLSTAPLLGRPGLQLQGGGIDPVAASQGLPQNTKPRAGQSRGNSHHHGLRDLTCVLVA